MHLKPFKSRLKKKTSAQRLILIGSSNHRFKEKKRFSPADHFFLYSDLKRNSLSNVTILFNLT